MIPENYAWLDTVGPLPRLLTYALPLVGPINELVIADWAEETGLARAASGDAVPWDGLFMAVVALRAEKPVVRDALWAKSWISFGLDAPAPALGDVLVFASGNHVGLYIGEDETAFHVLGGVNLPGDPVAMDELPPGEVGFSRIDKARLRAARRFYTVGAPESATPYLLDIGGGLAGGEV